MDGKRKSSVNHKLWAKIFLRGLHNMLKDGKIRYRDIAEHVGESYVTVYRQFRELETIIKEVVSFG